MILGTRIRQRREEKGLTAAELARQAQISKGYLSEIESGSAARPSADILYRLATALGTSIADLLGKEVRPVTRAIPDTLQAFATRAQLPTEDVEMLAQIRFRGEQPETLDDWQFLYESIKRSIRGGSGR